MGTEWPDRDWGPYHFSAALLYTLGGISAAVAAAALLWAATQRSHPSHRMVSVWTTFLLVLPGVLIAWAWRVATAGVVGSNIGGGMALMVVPVVVSGVLVGAVIAETVHRHRRLKHAVVLYGLAALTGPVLFAIAWHVA
jgi:hypothetical protein